MSETDNIALKAKALAEPCIKTLGLELYDLEYNRQFNGLVLRIYIDKPGSKVNVKDCQDVSHVLSVLYEEKDLIPGHYNLEVSSPGLDRVLKMEKDFIRYKGYKANIYYNELVEGKNNHTGEIKGVEDGKVLLEVKGVIIRIPVTNVKKGKLEFN